MYVYVRSCVPVCARLRMCVCVSHRVRWRRRGRVCYAARWRPAPATAPAPRLRRPPPRAPTAPARHLTHINIKLTIQASYFNRSTKKIKIIDQKFNYQDVRAEELKNMGIEIAT